MYKSLWVYLALVISALCLLILFEIRRPAWFFEDDQAAEVPEVERPPREPEPEFKCYNGILTKRGDIVSKDGFVVRC